MRIATWNVNSLKVRLPRIEAWLAEVQPDIACFQETKVADKAFPSLAFSTLGYESAHFGQGQWNGVAILSRVGLDDVVADFGDGAGPDPDARLLSASCAGIRMMSIYAPNGRAVGSDHYQYKLAWFERLKDHVAATCTPDQPVAVCGDFNVAPTDADVWDPTQCHGGTHVSPAEREAFGRLTAWGLVDAYRLHHAEGERFTWWDYRAGQFHKNFGMRIDHLLVSRPLAGRVIWAEIDREARKGQPTPSDHAPLLLDIDQPGAALDGGWTGVDERVAQRRGARPRSR
jgi:exodeoxyribonuclease-3